jgi:hypothetical protein
VGFGKGADAMVGIEFFARTAEQGVGEAARALVRCRKAHRSVEITGAYSARRQSRMNREHLPKIQEILHARLPKRGAFSDWRYRQERAPFRIQNSYSEFECKTMELRAKG